jgi:hypothetical protein
MKTACVITCAALLAVVGMTSCSAQPGTTSQYSSEVTRIQRLEQTFNNRQSTELDRLNAATELVRLGVRNPKYWSHVQREADKALTREKVAAREWKKQQTVQYARLQENAERDSRILDASASLTSGSTVAAASSTRKTLVTGYTQNNSVVEREEDVTNLPAIISLAASKRADARDDLRRAVDGDNVLIAAEAALGLASLKDHEWIPNIVDAARRFDEDLLFAQALVYFGTTNANDEAALLLRDEPELLEEIKETAKARGYEPFGTK